MSNFSAKLDEIRPCRSIFNSQLWGMREKEFGTPISVLLGANVTNNWEFTISRMKNKIKIIEQFSDEALYREYPYCYDFNNKGKTHWFPKI